MNRFLFSSLLFFCCFFTLFSQDSTLWSHQKNIGIGKVQFHDRAISRLNYSGPGVNLTATLNKQKKQKISSLNGRFFLGTSKNSQGTNSCTVTIPEISFDHRYLSTNSPFEFGYFVGFFANFRYYTSFVNNYFQYDGSFPLGPVINYKYDKELFGKKFHLDFSNRFSIIGLTFRPSYNSSIPEAYFKHSNSYFKTFLHNLKLQTWNNSIQWNSQINLSWISKKKQTRCISYNWNFSRYKKPFSSISAYHTIQFYFNF